jgi:hypothetical protein
MSARTHQSEDLTQWIGRLYAHPALLRMGHNQSAADLNLGLGWIYYGLGRLIQPTRAVVIGSYRGFVPLVIARALQDNARPGRVTFIDPSRVDDFWRDPARTQAWFASFGLDNVEHHLTTTQDFVGSAAYAAVNDVGLLFVDGYHTTVYSRSAWRRVRWSCFTTVWSRAIRRSTAPTGSTRCPSPASSTSSSASPDCN